MQNKKHLFFGVGIGVLFTLILSLIFSNVSIGGDYSARAISEKLNKIDAVLEQYYIGEYDQEAMIESMYAGYVEGVGDPYTTYFNEEELAAFLEETNGEYAGIGVAVAGNKDTNAIEIMTVFPESPAEDVGLLPGDIIIQVNGEDVSADTTDYAISQIKGEPGTMVNITIFRPSTGEELNFDIERQTIEVPTVYHEMLPDNVGYIQITNFDAVTYDQFMVALNDLTAQGMEGLIIDVRNNPGGLLDIVVEIADELLPEGDIVYVEDKNGQTKHYESDAECIDIPIAVVVNEYSASASEVLAGAVQDSGVGVLVGTQTYGKGVVQTLYSLKDGTAIKVTTAKYYTPNGQDINGQGLTPDYYVDMPLNVNLNTLEFEDDPQLQKAHEVVVEQIEAEK